MNRLLLNLNSYVKAVLSRNSKDHLKCVKRTFMGPSAFTPEFDDQYFSNPEFTEEIRDNIKGRKGVGDIDKVSKLYSSLQNCDKSERDKYTEQLREELMKIPNRTHPDVIAYGTEPRVTDVVGDKSKFEFKAQQFHQLAESIDGLRVKKLSLFAGRRSYYLQAFISSLEDALVKFTLDFLLKRKGFSLVSVPDLLPSDLINRCGMNTGGPRTQVYRLNRSTHHGDICLSGTSEMALAGMYTNEVIESEIPLRLAAVSRCYRAEVSHIQEEKGIFRVHQFTKVEMFGVTKGNVGDSEKLLEEFVSIQKELFSSLGLHFQVLDMPMHELGAPAYRKFDIEAWMPGREMYGEISSASNCTDYQSRRLNIRYPVITDGLKTLRHVHTVNGTACAVPRMLIALLETNQKEDGTFDLPEPLKAHLFNCQQQRKQTFRVKYLYEFPSIGCPS